MKEFCNGHRFLRTGAEQTVNIADRLEEQYNQGLHYLHNSDALLLAWMGDNDGRHYY